ncbi:unnamed protein product [Bursaphelenchus okinawaensis]|uniref:Serpentine receptor class gamma n=1 Tax=Bursaphelenchus okinawaensis TaxID=465554 RepID=A0A811KLE4_9BILA|nr:unnamed protein product [Bursaphelenchus okinawaensis]CAG9106153.1 unnamed protein product [Bursaphelenchus okinawaensis]
MLKVVLKYSTKEIGAYKWYIVGNQTFCAATFMVKAMAEDEPLFPYDVTVLGGVAYIVPTSTTFLRIFYAVFHIFFVSHFCFVTLMFLFRFAQTTNKQKMIKIMSNRKLLLYVYVPGFICICFLCYVDALYSLPDIDMYLQVFGNSNPMIADYIKGKPLLVEVSTWYNNYERFIPTLIGFFICSFSTYGCYSFQSQRSNTFGDRTRALYRTLINALLIEMAVIALAVVLPVFICQVLIGVKYRPIGTALMWRWLSLYPIFSMSFTMTYIGCYRRGFRQMMLKSIFGMEEKNGVIVQQKPSTYVSAANSAPS